LGVTPSRFGT
jgi:hypothetical protein